MIYEFLTVHLQRSFHLGSFMMHLDLEMVKYSIEVCESVYVLEMTIYEERIMLYIKIKRFESLIYIEMTPKFESITFINFK